MQLIDLSRQTVTVALSEDDLLRVITALDETKDPDSPSVFVRGMEPLVKALDHAWVKMRDQGLAKQGDIG